MVSLDPIRAVFEIPASDGRFEGELADLMSMLSLRRPVLLLAFAPKAAGTFFRTAAIEAIGGQLVRIGHAAGGRDVQPYLPTFIAYYLGKLTPDVLVAHAHMQALPANRNFLEALDLRPIVMLRPVPDMLASYGDMLDGDAVARTEGLNCKIPDGFLQMPHADKAQFLVDMLAPWYASYFATWLDYARTEPERVLVLDYADLIAYPAATLKTAIQHAGLTASGAVCQAALDKTWDERHALRFNRGTAGRGQIYFSQDQRAQIARLLGHYDIDAPMRARLMGDAPAA